MYMGETSRSAALTPPVNTLANRFAHSWPKDENEKLAVERNWGIAPKDI